MAGRFGTVQPTTRNGYLFGARRRNIPWESEGPDTGRRFQEGRAPVPRMAGDVRLTTARPGYMDAPQGVGRGFVPKGTGDWEINPTENAYEQTDPWKTFDDDLEPKVTRW